MRIKLDAEIDDKIFEKAKRIAYLKTLLDEKVSCLEIIGWMVLDANWDNAPAPDLSPTASGTLLSAPDASDGRKLDDSGGGSAVAELMKRYRGTGDGGVG